MATDEEGETGGMIMELSGLAQEAPPPAATPPPAPSDEAQVKFWVPKEAMVPDYPWRPPDEIFYVGLNRSRSWLDDFWPIAIPILVALGIMVVLAGREAHLRRLRRVRRVRRARGRARRRTRSRGLRDLDELGIIKMCRAKDMRPDRPAREQKWCLWDSQGRRILGRHPTRDHALRQEKLIQLRKRGII